MRRLWVLLNKGRKVLLRRSGVRTLLIQQGQPEMHLVRMSRILGFQILLVRRFRRVVLIVCLVERAEQVEHLRSVGCVLGFQVVLELTDRLRTLLQLHVQRAQPKPHLGDLLRVSGRQIVTIRRHRRFPAPRLLLQAADPEMGSSLMLRVLRRQIGPVVCYQRGDLFRRQRLVVLGRHHPVMGQFRPHKRRFSIMCGIRMLFHDERVVLLSLAQRLVALESNRQPVRKFVRTAIRRNFAFRLEVLAILAPRVFGSLRTFLKPPRPAEHPVPLLQLLFTQLEMSGAFKLLRRFVVPLPGRVLPLLLLNPTAQVKRCPP